MRILHVLDHSLPLHSGYTFRTRAILKAQQRLGIELCALTSQRHNLEADLPPLARNADPDSAPGEAGAEIVEHIEGLDFHRTPGLPYGPALLREGREIAALSGQIRRLAARWRPDIIHAHSPALGGAAALHAGRALGVPVVYEIRAFWEDAAVGNRTGREGSVKYRLTRALETQVAARADGLFTICNGLRDDLATRGIDRDKIVVMPNGVDLALFGDPPPRDAQLAAQLGLAEGAPVLGYIGSFYDYEGVDDLIAAMAHLRRRHRDARLLLVGGGTMDAAWRAAATALDCPEAVIFTGRVPHDQVERYYSLIDVLVYPRKASRLTDLVTPLKPLEAMAQARLVAASDVGGHRELITHGETGFLFAPDDPRDCARALADLLDRRGQWDAIRDNAIAHVRAQHDWSINAQRYLDVYHLLLSGSHEQGGALPPRTTTLQA